MVGADRQPLVTIGIPNFNYGRYLRQAVESALAQDYPNLEVLVSDNGSTDESAEVLANLRDPRLRTWRNERNLGLYPNWDRLFGEAAGEFFKILPADDELAPTFVSRCIAALQDTGSDVALTGFRAFGAEDWEVLPSRFGFHGPAVVASRPDLVRQVAGITVLVPPTSGLYRRSLVPEGYGGDASSRGADVLYWAKAVTRGRVVLVNEALAGVRFHGGQERIGRDTSRAIGEMFEALELLRPFDPGGYVDHLNRLIARTYGRSLLANLARGRWGVAWRTGRELKRGGRLAGALADALRQPAPAPEAETTRGG